MTYSEVILSLANNLATGFCEVYHSVELVYIFEDGQVVEKFPSIPRAKEWIKLAPTDVKDTIYIRRNGDDFVSEELRLSSCSKSYKMRTPLRIVYFNQNGDSAQALFKMMQSVLLQGIKISGVVRDKFKLLRDESSGEYNFNSKSVYVAVDVHAFWELVTDTCEQDFCISIDNPIKKCEPIITEST
jgi:hypothetical protein